MTERHLTVARTARYYLIEPAEEVREVWFVLHGYGQLASYFIRHFKTLDDGHRLIVAPEGLSRFYLTDHQRVGASWMTREDRLAEIDDYLAYLDALYEHIFKTVDRKRVRVCLLGFSQGTATASRWAALGRLQADRLIFWAGSLAHDLDFTLHGPTLARLHPFFVVGTEDEFITPDRIAEQEALLKQHHIPYHLISFEGRHRMNAEVLRTLADTISQTQVPPR